MKTKEPAAGHKKKLIQQGLLILVIFCLLLTIAFGWMTANRQAQARGVTLAAVNAQDVTGTLYRLEPLAAGTSEEDWVQVQRIEILNYLPATYETYKLVLKNTSQEQAYTCAVNLLHFSQTVSQKTDSTMNPIPDLADVILLNGVKVNQSTPADKGILSEQWKQNPEERTIRLAYDIVLEKATSDTEPATAEIQFTFRMKEEAANQYQNKKMTLEKIELATEKKGEV